MELLIKGKTVIIDDEDYELIKNYTWCNMQNKYMHAYIPGSGHKGRFIRMHRLIMDAKSGSIIDHINGNGFDNRKSNLRVCTTSQNLMNRGMNKNNPFGLKGVKLDKRRGTYYASICVNYKSKFLGSYKTPEEAHAAYVKALTEYHGEFARAV